MKKKITLIWPYFFPQSGAAAVRGKSFFDYLNNKYEVNVISIKRSEKNKHEKVLFIPLRLSLKPLIFINDFINLYKNINFKKPDLIIASLPSILIGIHSTIISKLLKIKIILDLRDLEIDEKIKIRNFFWKYCLNNASKIFVTSILQKQIVNSIYKINNKKIYLIPNGNTKELILSGKKKEKKIYDLIFLGTLVPERNLPGINEFINYIFKIKPNLKIVFVGVDQKNEETKKFIDNLSQENFFKNVTIIKEVSPEKAFNFVKKSKIGFVSLINEKKYLYQIPTKIYEYFAAGLAVAALIPDEAVEIKKIIEKNNTGFYSQTPFALAKKTITILNDSGKLKELKNNSINIANKYERTNSLKILDEII